MTDFEAINVIRSNRSLLKRGKFKDVKNIFLESSGKTELKFKEVSKVKLELIKTRIRNEAKKATKDEILLYIFCTIVTLGFLCWLSLNRIKYL